MDDCETPLQAPRDNAMKQYQETAPRTKEWIRDLISSDNEETAPRNSTKKQHQETAPRNSTKKQHQEEGWSNLGTGGPPTTTFLTGGGTGRYSLRDMNLGPTGLPGRGGPAPRSGARTLDRQACLGAEDLFSQVYTTPLPLPLLEPYCNSTK